MRQNVLKYSALLAVAVAACSEPTGVNGGLSPEGPNLVVTSSQGTITKIAGDNKVWASAAANPVDPSVIVRDLSGNPIANEPVTFTTNTLPGVTRGTVGVGASCPLAGTSVTVNTNSSGVAAVKWCSAAIGGQQLSAQAGTGGVSVLFEGVATTAGVAPYPVKIAGEETDDASATMGGQVRKSNPTVYIFDGTVVIPSILVTWTPQADGTADGFTTVEKRANSSGQSAVSWRLRTTAGTNTMTARVNKFTTAAGVPGGSVTFTVTGLAVGTAINCVSGCTNTATTASGSRFSPKDPVVQIVTSSGAGVGAGVPVTVTYGTGTNACGSAMSGQTLAQPLYTDAGGRVAAPWCNVTATTGTKTITFSAGDLSRTISGTVNYAFGSGGTLTIDSGSGFTCTVGQVATPDLAVTYSDDNGAKVSGGSVTFTAPAGGSLANGSQSGNSITVTTNSAGQAAARYTCSNTSGSQAVSVSTSTGATATITGTASTASGTAASITKIAGDNQTATAGTAVAKNPNVLVRDQHGNLLNSVTVNFTPAGPSGAPATNAGRGTATGNATCGTGCYSVVTGSQGQTGSAATVWTLSTTTGANTLTATIAGTSITTTFNATGN